MSDTAELKEHTTEEPSVTIEEVQRMLEASREETEALRRERDEERISRRRTEQERDTAAGHAQTEAERRYMAEVQSASEAVAAATAEADRAEDAYAAAMEVGDFKAAAKAQRAMAEATNRHGQQTARKQWLDANKESLTRAPVPQRQSSGDDLDQLFPGVQLLAEERTFLRARPEVVTNENYRRRLVSASSLAETEGNRRGSQSYFDRISELLGENKQQSAEREGPAPRERGASADLAPARRSVPGQPPAGSREIRLSADQREVADALYGNPAGDNYIADEAQRYKHYSDNLQKMMQRQ